MNAPDSGQALPAPPPAPVGLETLRWRDPPRWIAAGLRDCLRAPLIGVFSGAAFMVSVGFSGVSGDKRLYRIECDYDRISG